MCRGKVDQWTGDQDITGALVSTGQLWSAGIIILHPTSTLQSESATYRIILNWTTVRFTLPINHSFLTMII